MSGNYETMMDVSGEIRNALLPCFLRLTLLGTAKHPVLVNIANVAAIGPAHSYSNAKEIVGTEVTLNHGVGGDETGESVTIRVVDSFDDICRGLRGAVNIWYPQPAAIRLAKGEL